MVESSTINERRFAAADGRRFMARALAACGVPGDDADAVAEMMLFADLRGVDSHGIVRLPSYIARLKAGGINPQAATSASSPRRRRRRWSMATTAWAIWSCAVPREIAIEQGGEDRHRLGRHAAQQPCRRRRVLCDDAAGARHDRALSRGRQQQPHGAHGRDRAAARHQSHRHRHPDAGRAADRARHRHHRDLGRQDPARRRQRREAGRKGW